MFYYITVLVLFAYLSGCEAQIPSADGCDPITSTQLKDLLTLVPAIAGADGDAITLNLMDVYVNCLAAGRFRGRYREATYTVRFTGAASDPAAVRLGTFDVICLTGGIWGRNNNQPFVFIEMFPPANITALTTNSSVQTDCHRCNAPNHIQSPLNSPNDDILRHCRRCPNECLAENLTLCEGLFPTVRCCNVYDEGVCATSCPANESALPPDYECECNVFCQNGGSVNDECNMCTCPEGVTGRLCETVLDPCVPNPCQNGATCSFTTYPMFTCTCPPGFTGVNCSIVLDPCDSNPCLNGGTCFNAGYPNFMCTCPPGYTGPTCDMPTTCTDLVCLNGGTCIIQNGQQVCICPTNFVGATCENCTIPNCITCSVQNNVGVCTECLRGFLLQNGRCAFDCSMCDSIQDQDRSNNCKFFCQLEAWQGLASACDLTVPNIAQPSADLPIDQLYAATLNAAQTAETAWVSGASAAIDNLVAPTRSLNATLSEWRSTTRQWAELLRSWLARMQGIDSTFPSFDVDSLLNGIDDDSRVQEVFRNISSAWMRITDLFNARKRCN